MSGLIIGILNTTDSVVHQFVFSGYSSLVTYLRPVIITLTSIFVAGFGLATIRGMIDTPIQHVINIVLKYSICIALATNWTVFSELIYEFFSNGPDRVISTIMSNAKFNWIFFKHHSVNSAMQEGLNTGMEHSLAIIKQGSMMNFSPYIIGTLSALSTLLISGFSLGLLVMAKVGLGVCLILSPIFILCFMFSSTRAITERWMQHIIGFALMPIGVHSVMFFILTLMDSTLAGIEGEKLLTFSTSAAYILLCIISLPLLLQIKNLMASISSGFTLSTMGSIGAVVDMGGQLTGKTTKALHSTGKSVAQTGMSTFSYITERVRNI